MQPSRLFMASWLLLIAAFAALPPWVAAAQPPAFTCDGAPGVYLYEGLNFTGRCLKLTADAPDLGTLRPISRS